MIGKATGSRSYCLHHFEKLTFLKPNVITEGDTEFAQSRSVPNSQTSGKIAQMPVLCQGFGDKLFLPGLRKLNQEACLLPPEVRLDLAVEYFRDVLHQTGQRAFILRLGNSIGQRECRVMIAREVSQHMTALHSCSSLANRQSIKVMSSNLADLT